MDYLLNKQKVERTRFFQRQKNKTRKFYNKYLKYNSSFDPNKVSKKVFDDEKAIYVNNLKKKQNYYTPPYDIIEMEKNIKRRKRKQLRKNKNDYSLE